MDPKQIVHSDPEVLGGTPVFAGTRVPVQALRAGWLARAQWSAACS